MWSNSREKKDIELVNLMKHSEDQLLFYCGGSQKPSQRVVWVHVRVSSFTAQVQTWQWRQLPLWVADSFLIWLMIGVVIRTGVASSHRALYYNMYWIIVCYVTDNPFEWNFFSISVFLFYERSFYEFKQHAFTLSPDVRPLPLHFLLLLGNFFCWL